MKATKTLFGSSLALAVALASNLAFAQADDFVDDASAKGIAEIESARIALEHSQAQDIRDFANRMIEDHTQANQKLKQLAQEKNLEISDEAMLMDKAKAMILELRDGEDFNEAYANNQVVAHEQTIELFRDYLQSGENPDLRQYAETTLPKLEEHLTKARELQMKYADEN